jgi:hypothetical protein
MVQVKKRVLFSNSIRNCCKHCIQVRMVPGELVAVLEDKFITWAQDKETSLLPEIAICSALAETLPHGLYAVDQGFRAKRLQEPALEPEGFICDEVLVYVHFAGEMNLLDKMPRTSGTAAPDGNQRNSRIIQFPLDAHEGSSLLPREHSAEMAEKGKRYAPAGPERLEFDLMALERLYRYSGNTGLQFIIGHFSLLCMHGERCRHHGT